LLISQESGPFEKIAEEFMRAFKVRGLSVAFASNGSSSTELLIAAKMIKKRKMIRRVAFIFLMKRPRSHDFPTVEMNAKISGL